MQKFIKLSLASLVVFVVVMSTGMGHGFAAGSATLGLSPSGANYSAGQTFMVSIIENSGGDSVNVVGADFTYNSSMLQFVGASCNSGAFEIQFPGTSSAGITCGTATAKAGSQVVGSASFKVIAAGSASIGFASSSNIYRSTDNTNIWNGNTSGGNYNLTAAATAAPVKKKATPTTTTTQQAVPAPAAVTEPVQPAVVQPVADTKTQAVVVASTKDNNSTAWLLTSGLLIAAIAGATYYLLKRNRTQAPKLKNSHDDLTIRSHYCSS
jgi:hypothetical protein